MRERWREDWNKLCSAKQLIDVVDSILEKFYGVNHDWWPRVADKRLLGLIRGFLTAGVLENGLVGPTTKGTPQGGPLSPAVESDARCPGQGTGVRPLRR